MEGGTGPVSMMPAMATLSVRAFGEDNGVRKIMSLVDSEPTVVHVWLCKALSSTKATKLVDNFNSANTLCLACRLERLRGTRAFSRPTARMFPASLPNDFRDIR